MEWEDPIKEIDSNKIVIKTFTREQTREINQRINNKIDRANYISRKNSIKARIAADKAYITF